MADSNDIEQKVKITYDTNADEVASEVGSLSDNMDNVTESIDKTDKATKKLEATEKSFKAQMRESTEELRKNIQKYGELSKEATESAKKVANLKDQMQFAKDLTDNFNPDQKMKALGAATQIASTATSGLVSGYALLGDQGEDTQKMLLKVQAAMAFSESISNLSNLGDQWNLFKTVVKDTYAQIITSKQKSIVLTGEETIAERIKIAVMKTNPYILLASIIAAVTIATVAYIAVSRDQEKQIEATTKSIDEQIHSLELLNDHITEQTRIMRNVQDLEVLHAKSIGESDEAIQKLIKTQKQQDIEFTKDNEIKANKIAAQSWKDLMNARASSDDDLIKKAESALEKADAAAEKARIDARQAYTESLKYDLEAQIENNKKREEFEKEQAAKRKAAREKQKQLEEAEAKKRDDDLKQQGVTAEALYDSYLKIIADSKQAFADRLKTDEQKLLDDEQKTYETKLKNLQDANLSTQELTLEHENIINDIKLQAQQKQYDSEKAMEDAKLAFKKEITQQEYDIAASGISLLSSLAGKNKTLQKGVIVANSALGIAKIVNETAAADAADTAWAATLGPAGPAYLAPKLTLNHVSAAIGVGSNLAATAKALSAIGGGSAGGGGGATANKTPGGGGSAAPQVNFQGSSENQIANGVSNKMAEQPPIKAFVVESELTNVQNTVVNQQNANTLGN